MRQDDNNLIVSCEFAMCCFFILPAFTFALTAALASSAEEDAGLDHSNFYAIFCFLSSLVTIAQLVIEFKRPSPSQIDDNPIITAQKVMNVVTTWGITTSLGASTLSLLILKENDTTPIETHRRLLCPLTALGLFSLSRIILLVSSYYPNHHDPFSPSSERRTDDRRPIPSPDDLCSFCCFSLIGFAATTTLVSCADDGAGLRYSGFYATFILLSPLVPMSECIATINKYKSSTASSLELPFNLLVTYLLIISLGASALDFFILSKENTHLFHHDKRSTGPLIALSLCCLSKILCVSRASCSKNNESHLPLSEALDPNETNGLDNGLSAVSPAHQHASGSYTPP